MKKVAILRGSDSDLPIVEKGINVPVRVDHVPTMKGEQSALAGYDALGRLFAIGYLKGILDSCKK